MNKSKKQKILTFFLFSMIFLTQNNINFLTDNDTILGKEIQEIQSKEEVGEVKSSAVITSLIRINASANGVDVHNWTSAQDAGYVSPGGDGSPAKPYIIENLEIDGQNSRGGIEIVDSRQDEMAMDIYFRIENNLIYNVGSLYSMKAGIKLYRTQHGTITNNNISSSRKGNYGIHVVGYMPWDWPFHFETSKDLNITENTITDTERGIFIEEASEQITISDNVAKYNLLAGIYILGRCTRITVLNNFLSENGVGIVDTDSNNHMMPEWEPSYFEANIIKNNVIYKNKIGFYLIRTRGSTISYNNISSNSETGIKISGSSWNYIANNTIADNSEEGILMIMGMGGSFRNRIYGNQFLRNGEHAVELTGPPPFYIFGGWENNWSWWKTGVEWSYPIIGNYWNNYTELGADAVDADDDGFGDIPYSFVGNEDPKPIYNDGIEGHVIFINGSLTPNNPYNWTGWASKKFWVTSGNGESDNPYVISPNDFWDGEIDAWENEAGITIVDSMNMNHHFKIEGVTIINSTEAGIKIENINAYPRLIINNNISFNDGHGISLKNSRIVNITDNIISNNSKTGIYLYNGTGGPSPIKVRGNVITGNGVDGIYIGQNSDNNEVIDNTIAYNGQYGVNINETTGGGCNDTTVYNNNFEGNGINGNDNGTDTIWYLVPWGEQGRGNYWADYDGDDGDDDGIGDTGEGPLYPLKPYKIGGSSLSEDLYPIWDDGFAETPLFIDGMATGVNAHNWTWASKRLFVSGTGWSWDPYVIENVKFNGTDSKSAITIINSDKYFRIENCTLYDIGGLDSGKAGIYLYNVQYGDLINNTFSTNYDGNYGIHLDKCDNNPITKINITDHLIEPNPIKFKYGIYLDKSGINIDNYIVIDGNTIKNNTIGIFLNNMSSFNNITNNEITGNTNTGIFINDSSADTKIYYNDIIENENGIIIDNNANTNHIVDNEIKDNINFGLYINSSSNDISYNYFIDNGINAQDDSLGGNFWYKDLGLTGRGNFWSNYTTELYDVGVKDENDDGIGDIAYNLTGIAEAQDKYPLFDDGHNGSRIVINGATDWPAVSAKTWCTGSGTINDPYVIEGLEINGQLNGSVIYIYDSSAYFIIRDCILYNSSETESPTPAGGIRLWKVKNATIINNNISNNDGHGIILMSGFMETEETRNVVIRDNLIKNNNGTGIYLNGSYVHDTLIDNNTLNSNGINGISIFDNAHDTIVSNNILYNNTEIGIAITNFQPPPPTGHWDYYFMVWVQDPWDYNDIINNTITLGDTGIGIESSFEIFISGNTISQTESNGIAIGGFNSRNITIINNIIYAGDFYGITLERCFNSNITNNIIKENSIGIGLSFDNVDNTIINNDIFNNTDTGLYINDFSCEHNKIYNNNFTDNTDNAFDDGILNQWYINITGGLQAGNYWDDYTGNDTDDDGIGDTPYNVDGFMAPEDFLPKWWDPPVILKTLPVDDAQFPKEVAPDYEIKITEGLGKVFWYEIYTMPSMTLEDTSPYMMLNGNPGEVRTGKIEHDMWSDLSNGTYTIIFYVNDSQGMVSSTDVIVEKLSPVPSGTVIVSDGSSSSDSSSDDTTTEEELMPWYIQAAMTGAVSASVGLIIKQTYSSAKKRKIILEKIHENFAKVDNLETFLKDKLAYDDWEKIQEPWKQYQNDLITERQMIKQSKKSLGKKFTELFIPHKKSKRRTT